MNPTIEMMRNEVRRQLRNTHGQDKMSIDVFFEMWGELVNTLIAWGCTASEIIRDVYGIEDALDCIGWEVCDD